MCDEFSRCTLEMRLLYNIGVYGTNVARNNRVIAVSIDINYMITDVASGNTTCTAY